MNKYSNKEEIMNSTNKELVAEIAKKMPKEEKFIRFGRII